eukprot:862683-Prorocentrum_minimum.AAC.1
MFEILAPVGEIPARAGEIPARAGEIPARLLSRSAHGEPAIVGFSPCSPHKLSPCRREVAPSDPSSRMARSASGVLAKSRLLSNNPPETIFAPFVSSASPLEGVRFRFVKSNTSGAGELEK